MKSDEDLTRLEESIAHLTLANEELSGELEKQWKRIEALERKSQPPPQRPNAFTRSFAGARSSSSWMTTTSLGSIL